MLSYLVACELATDETEPVCGDIVCNGTETCETCEQDCGACEPVDPFCGDGSCNGSETCETCQEDCGECPPPGANFQVNQLVEAEDGTLASPMAAATGGGVTYLATSGIDQGSASYTYDILEDGDYYFEADVYAASVAHNSFFVGLSTDNVSGNSETVWDAVEHTTYANDLVSHRGPGGSQALPAGALLLEPPHGTGAQAGRRALPAGGRAGS